MRSLQNLLFSLYAAVMTLFIGCSDLPGHIISDPVDEERPEEETPHCSLPASKLTCSSQSDCHSGEECAFPAPGPECSKETPCHDPGICVCTSPSDPSTEGVPTTGTDMPVPTTSTSEEMPADTSGSGAAGESETGQPPADPCLEYCQECQSDDLENCVANCESAVEYACASQNLALIICFVQQGICNHTGPICHVEFLAADKCNDPCKYTPSDPDCQDPQPCALGAGCPET